MVIIKIIKEAFLIIVFGHFKELQKNGYNTALVGKWHLASEPKGFDYFKYHDNLGQQGFYWDPIYNENGKKVKEKGYATFN